MGSKNDKKISAINCVFSDMSENKKNERLNLRIKPTQADLNDREKQCELGKKIFESGEPITEEELIKMGYFVRQQYIVEKRRQEASIVAYNSGRDWYLTGKEIEMATKIYQSNKDFLRGYKDALNEEINNQSKGSIRK